MSVGSGCFGVLRMAGNQRKASVDSKKETHTKAHKLNKAKQKQQRPTEHRMMSLKHVSQRREAIVR